MFASELWPSRPNILSLSDRLLENLISQPWSISCERSRYCHDTGGNLSYQIPSPPANHLLNLLHIYSRFNVFLKITSNEKLLVFAKQNLQRKSIKSGEQSNKLRWSLEFIFYLKTNISMKRPPLLRICLVSRNSLDSTFLIPCILWRCNVAKSWVSRVE